jgi:isopenicillin-N epimerase
VPYAIEYVGGLLPGGWATIHRRAHAQVVSAQGLLAQALGVPRPCPPSMLGALAALPLPDDDGPPPRSPLYVSALQDTLLRDHGIEVPIVPWPQHPRRLIRVSAAPYNTPEEYTALADALSHRFGKGR